MELFEMRFSRDEASLTLKALGIFEVAAAEAARENLDELEKMSQIRRKLTEAVNAGPTPDTAQRSGGSR